MNRLGLRPRLSFSRLPPWARVLGGYVGAALAFAVVLVVAGELFRPDFSAPPPPQPAAEIDRALTDRAWRPGLEPAPSIWRDVDYSAGTAAPWFPKGEPPVLRELVERGDFPPVADRTGPEPLVLEGVEGLGRYGGTWFRLSPSDAEISGLMRSRLSYAQLVRWSPHGYPIVPHLARTWTISPDKRIYTFTLRRGMRWSDGHPFTAHDILYWWDWEANYFQSWPQFMTIDGQLGTIEFVDELTVRFVFPKPHALFLERLASTQAGGASSSVVFAPKHYLAKFHPELGDPAFIDANLRALGLPGKRALYERIHSAFNPACPRMWPWIYREYSPSAPHRFVRNPYYFAVDSAGNQLPYLDRIVSDVKAPSLIAPAARDASFQSRYIEFQDYTQLAGQAEAGGYELRQWFSSSRTALTFYPNLNRRIDPADPSTAWKQQVLNEKAFRRALSLALDRQAIIEAVNHGVGEPAQSAPGPSSRYHNEKLLHAFTDYDPVRANALLDGLGLTERDADGFRTFPDGSRMAFFLTTTDAYPPDIPILVVDYWRAIGVRVYRQVHDRAFFDIKTFGRDYDIIAWPAYDGLHGLVDARDYVPVYSTTMFAPAYGRWFLYGGLSGSERARESGALEPPPGSDVRRAMELANHATMEITEQALLSRFNGALDIAADNVWSISVSTTPPKPIVVKKGFRNVPRHAVEGFLLMSPGNTGLETFFWDHPHTSSEVAASIRSALVSESTLPGLVSSTSAAPSLPPDRALIQNARDGSRPGTLPSAALPSRGVGLWVFWAFAIALLIFAGVRHPFIWRRLLLMIPTLGVISVIIFTVLQLPPGDFITSKLLKLEMEGNESSLHQMDDLRAAFRLDKSPLERYLYWSGLMWFTTFDPQDTGLLQGNLGRSMDTNEPVTAIIGDRIALTVIITFCTVLFIWTMAVPIGVYSAVRQHSIWDYSLTFVGFLGMSVPSFLLALVLMYLSSRYFDFSASGLFSPEYAAQPDWTGGKVLDLLKRLWIPVVVVGAASVAHMIRVMRANLLDELRKPYVTTARAKGVPPVRLLFKYPVRMAINPFVSGIGSLFPHLVSGDSIVAIVLSLPTIAPLLLTALLRLDTYLAASLLMVLSTLAVVGTLVSDLLLQWLDPRVQLTGKRK